MRGSSWSGVINPERKGDSAGSSSVDLLPKGDGPSLASTVFTSGCCLCCSECVSSLPTAIMPIPIAGFSSPVTRRSFIVSSKPASSPSRPNWKGSFPAASAADRIMLVDPEGDVWASFDGLKRNAASAVVAEIEGRRKKHQHL